MQENNPFIYEAATNLSPEKIEELYIDIEKSDLIISQKNIFIEGYRGSGKSMLLKYNSFDMKYQRDKELKFIGIYTSCQTALFSKKEYELLDNKLHSLIIAEHILVLTMTESLVDSLLYTKLLDETEENIFINEIEFYFDLEGYTLIKFSKFIKKELLNLQRNMNTNPLEFYQNAFTYSSLIIPIITALKELEKLKNTHFSFFIDDGQNLSDIQKETLNAWISFRDTSDISFKISIASKKEYKFYTNTNSVILENHDYMVLDLEKEFFGHDSRFYKFAKNVIEKRLEKYSIQTTDAKIFFPEHDKFTKEIQEISAKFIIGYYPEQKEKSPEFRRTNVSKFNRAIYFRERLENSKANYPTIPYTGFETLTNISTGIIRNLLIPCTLMYGIEKEKKEVINCISPQTQYEVIKELSEAKWEEIKNLSATITDCDENTSDKIFKFLTNFGNKLKAILLDKTSSEKQILTFTIEKLEDNNEKDEILHILTIAEKAGLIYSRIGAGKNNNRTTWYTPNRILWSSIGLDPVGQNGRLNITPYNFINMTKKIIPHSEINLEGLFDDL